MHKHSFVPDVAEILEEIGNKGIPIDVRKLEYEIKQRMMEIDRLVLEVDSELGLKDRVTWLNNPDGVRTVVYDIMKFPIICRTSQNSSTPSVKARVLKKLLSMCNYFEDKPLQILEKIIRANSVYKHLHKLREYHNAVIENNNRLPIQYEDNLFLISNRQLSNSTNPWNRLIKNIEGKYYLEMDYMQLGYKYMLWKSGHPLRERLHEHNFDYHKEIADIIFRDKVDYESNPRKYHSESKLVSYGMLLNSNLVKMVEMGRGTIVDWHYYNEMLESVIKYMNEFKELLYTRDLIISTAESKGCINSFFGAKLHKEEFPPNIKWDNNLAPFRETLLTEKEFYKIIINKLYNNPDCELIAEYSGNFLIAIDESISPNEFLQKYLEDLQFKFSDTIISQPAFRLVTKGLMYSDNEIVIP